MQLRHLLDSDCLIYPNQTPSLQSHLEQMGCEPPSMYQGANKHPWTFEPKHQYLCPQEIARRSPEALGVFGCRVARIKPKQGGHLSSGHLEVSIVTDPMMRPWSQPTEHKGPRGSESSIGVYASSRASQELHLLCVGKNWSRGWLKYAEHSQEVDSIGLRPYKRRSERSEMKVRNLWGRTWIEFQDGRLHSILVG